MNAIFNISVNILFHIVFVLGIEHTRIYIPVN
jgi:hypothetical protein